MPAHVFTHDLSAQFSKQNRLFVLPIVDRGGLLVIPPGLIKTLHRLS